MRESGRSIMRRMSSGRRPRLVAIATAALLPLLAAGNADAKDCKTSSVKVSLVAQNQTGGIFMLRQHWARAAVKAYGSGWGNWTIANSPSQYGVPEPGKGFLCVAEAKPCFNG
jgi:hypothetical protein